MVLISKRSLRVMDDREIYVRQLKHCTLRIMRIAELIDHNIVGSWAIQHAPEVHRLVVMVDSRERGFVNMIPPNLMFEARKSICGVTNRFLLHDRMDAGELFDEGIVGCVGEFEVSGFVDKVLYLRHYVSL